jgi:hypothetical protein
MSSVASNQSTIAPMHSSIVSNHAMPKAFLLLIVVAILYCTNMLIFHVVSSSDTLLHAELVQFETTSSSFFISCFAGVYISSMRPKIVHLTNLISPIDHVITQSPKLQ